MDSLQVNGLKPEDKTLVKRKNQKEYFKKNLSNFQVRFDKLFENDEYAKYNNFILSVSTQRSYALKIDFICRNINEFLNIFDPSKFLYQYFSLKKNIDEIKLDKEQFIDYLIENIYTSEIMDEANKYVEMKYNPEIYDSFIRTVMNNKSGIKVSEENIFDHIHIKTLYSVSIMIQLFLPMALHYLTINNYKVTAENKQFINNLAEKIFERVKLVTGMDIYAKLYKSVYKSIKTTENSDSVGWSRQAIFAETKESVVEDVLSKLLITIIPQFDYDRNVMNYVTSIVNKSIEHALRTKDKYDAKVSSIDDSNVENDNGSTDVESVENIKNKKDEMISMPRKFLVDPTIDKLIENNNIYISDEEYAFYYNSFDNILKHQKNLVMQVFAKDFGGEENISNITKAQFIKLVIILYKILKRKNLNELASILVAKIGSYRMNRFNSKYLNKKLLENELYINLLNTKYKAFKNMFLKKFVDKKINDNPFINNIITMVNNDFYYNEFNDPRNGKLILDKKDDKEDILINQLLIMCNIIV